MRVYSTTIDTGVGVPFEWESSNEDWEVYEDEEDAKRRARPLHSEESETGEEAAPDGDSD